MAHISETKQVGDFYVHRYSICARPCVVYDVWEKESGHSTVTHLDGYDFWMGKVCSRPLPEHLNKLPDFSEERYQRVTSYHCRLQEMCQGVILQAYPHLSDIEYSTWDGDIETTCENVCR